MGIAWVARLEPDGRVTLAVANTGAIYHDVNETHIEALQRVLDHTASRRINELEDLYTAVQDQEAERRAAAKYRDTIDAQWETLMASRGYVLLRLMEPGEVSVDKTARLLVSSPDGNQHQIYSFASRGTPALSQRADLLDSTGAAQFRVVDGLPQALKYAATAAKAEATWPGGRVKLSNLLGPNDEFAERSRFTRQMMSKATVPLRVHTTTTGAAKRKSMDDSVGPYGGAAKQWELDAENVSLDEHLREMRAVVDAAAAGLMPAPKSLPEVFAVVHDDRSVEVLRRVAAEARGRW